MPSETLVAMEEHAEALAAAVEAVLPTWVVRSVRTILIAYQGQVPPEVEAAIVDDVPGVTRDRNYAEASFRGRPFRLVDTGGLDPSASEGMLALIRHQTQLAIAEADVLVFVMDGRDGVTPADEAVVSLLRGIKKPVYYAINKIDTAKAEPLVADFYRLGLDHLYPVSAEHGIGQMKRDIFAELDSPARLGALRAIKAGLDPAGLFNPAKLIG